MKLTEACGIILGANIGTTVTALLVSFKLSSIAPVFVFAGAIMINFFKNNKVRKYGDVVMGFGVLFVGISSMSSAMGTLSDNQAVINFLANFTNPLLALILGLVITSVVQSSSVTVSILVVMASQGLVDLRACMFVILGCNIGACTSAVLAAIGNSKNAKRAALIHLLFNVFGTILMFILLMLFGDIIENIVRICAGHTSDLGRNVALTHFLFKVFQVIVFYPFMDLIIKLTFVLVPGEDTVGSDNNFSLRYITTGHSLPNPAVAMYLAVQEMERMAKMAVDNLNLAVECLLENNEEKSKKVFEMEKYIDFLDEQISDYLVKINQNTLPIADSNLLAAYFHVVNDIERIGDHADSIAEIIPQMYENEIQMSESSKKELAEMMELINTILDESLDMFVTGNTARMQEINELEDKIDQMERNLQNAHIYRLNQGKCSAQAGIYFSDVVSGLERVGDHAINIAFALEEAKTRSTVKNA
jgi:phosphate:Na+ symporter